MNWYQLKTNHCPQCKSVLLDLADERGMIYCRNEHCGFRIHKDRMQEVINNLHNKQFFDSSNQHKHLKEEGWGRFND